MGKCIKCKKEITIGYQVDPKNNDDMVCTECYEEMNSKEDLKQIVSLLENLEFTDEYIGRDIEGSFVAFTKDNGKYQLIKVYKEV